MHHRKRSTKTILKTNSEKGGIRSPFPIRELSQNDKSNYCYFYKGHDHNTDDFVQPNDAIDGLVKRGRLYEYMKVGKREREDSSKGKSPSKSIEMGARVKIKRLERGNISILLSSLEERPGKPPLQWNHEDKNR